MRAGNATFRPVISCPQSSSLLGDRHVMRAIPGRNLDTQVILNQLLRHSMHSGLKTETTVRFAVVREMRSAINAVLRLGDKRSIAAGTNAAAFESTRHCLADHIRPAFNPKGTRSFTAVSGRYGTGRVHAIDFMDGSELS